MKKTLNSMLGVTLLEIMLVLAVAAMLIVISVRYYQSATASQQANTILQQLQGITAMADQLAQSKGDYSTTTVANLTPLLPGGAFIAPWGGAITIPSAAATSYGVSVASPPADVCSLIDPKLKNNTHYTSVSCTTSGLSYTYKASP